MKEHILIPSVDLRIGSLVEFNRSRTAKACARIAGQKHGPVVTLTRDYGCTGYPVAERLRQILREETGDEWELIDRAILDEVARHHHISADILGHLGEKHRILDEFLSNFSPRWKSDHDYFTLLSRHVMALAEQGNVIILELGGASIARHIDAASHFRIYGSEEFRVATLAGRLQISPGEAETIMRRQQKLRDKFSRDFLDRDDHDPTLYHLLFNNDRCPAEKIARAMAGCVLGTPSG